MPSVSWNDIEDYVIKAFAMRARVERRDVMKWAEEDDASDDMIDAIDAIGSRVFKNPEDTRAFLTSQGWIE